MHRLPPAARSEESPTEFRLRVCEPWSDLLPKGAPHMGFETDLVAENHVEAQS
jgi:hypothetical protein